MIRKQHAPEFRQGVLKLAERISVAAAARELSLYESQLYNWRSKQQQQLSSSDRATNSPLKMPVSNASWRSRGGVGSCDNAVHEAFTQAKQQYGALCLTDELHVQGYHFNVKTVAASLRRQALREKASRKFSPVSYHEHGFPVSIIC